MTEFAESLTRQSPDEAIAILHKTSFTNLPDQCLVPFTNNSG